MLQAFYRGLHVYRVDNEAFGSRRSRLLVEPLCGRGESRTEGTLHQMDAIHLLDACPAMCPVCRDRIKEALAELTESTLGGQPTQ